MISIELLSKFMGSEWAKLLHCEFDNLYMRELSAFLKKERLFKNVYPPQEDVFNAYKLTPFSRVKVVVLGQDPYHQPGQAHGLAFSVRDPYVKTPPSLVNIFKEVEKDVGFNVLTIDCDLTRWATQGVFLLNTVLTVRKGEPKSHKHIGWLKFTAKTIEHLAKRKDPVVFMLWGKEAESYKPLIQSGGDNHKILIASHPSPYSYNISFKDSMMFKRANEFLVDNHKEPIDWT